MNALRLLPCASSAEQRDCAITSSLGLVELLLVLIGAMGWGAYELWSVRRPRKERRDREPGDKAGKSD